MVLSRTARRASLVLAITLGLITLALDMATVPLDGLVHQGGTGGPVADGFAVAVAVIPTAAVGTVLAVRRPGNPIGWLLLAILVVGFSPTSQYAVLDYRMHHGILPLGWAAVALQETWPMFLFFVALLLWLFPDGRLPAGRWRRPSVVISVTGLLTCLAASSRGVQVLAEHDVRIGANGDLTNPTTFVQTLLFGAVIVGALASWVAWLAVQIPTYRRADGERRQQLKWLYGGAAIFVASLFIGVFIVPVAMGEAPGWGTQPAVNDLTTLSASALPACMGVAVLRYRLYEIDRIISRVVAYAIISAVLAGVFAGLVVLATVVLPVKTPVAIAAATLAVASLFTPLRRRVQRAVDRRFNRARYNAEAVVAAFATRVVQTVDLEAVRSDLIGVVQQTFEPTRVSVWLSGAWPDPSAPRARGA
jgi:hypothetical protein